MILQKVGSIWVFLMVVLSWAGLHAQDVTLPGAGGCGAAAVAGTWTVPCGVTSIIVEVYGGGGGAGGGGGGSNGGFYDTRGGGAGGGGGYSTVTINVTAGAVFNYSVGSGGCGGSNGSDNNDGGNGTAGSNSSFSGTDAGGGAVSLAANGGARGTGGSGDEGNPGTGGAGGTASGGSTNTSGTAGNSGSGGNGGNGGTGAGPGGGAGGASSGASGATYGGGGAGGGNSTGGIGGAGGILITYGNPIVQPPGPTIASGAPACAADGTSTINGYSAAETYSFTPVGPTVGAGGVISGMVTGTSYTVVSGTAGCTSLPSAPFSNAAATGIAPVPTIASTAASCSSTELSTISNYNAAMTYTFTPGGPSVGAGGVISGMTVGTNYTVIANEGSCISAASASFSNSAQLPGANITISGTLSHCAGGSTTITGNGGVSYVWDDAGVSTTANISATVGTYNVVGTDANGCTGTASAVITISAPFAIGFSGALTHCPGGTTTVTASGGATYVWNDPANTTTAAAVLTQGMYTLTATDAAGCVSSDDVIITQVSAPVADFIVQDACDGVPATFTDASTVAAGALTAWDWDFGDNGTSNLQDPTHTYANSGVYDVTLIASSGTCTGTVTYQATVFESPVADFSTANVCLGTPAVFTDNSSVTGGAISGWAWDFGGLGNSIVQSPSYTFAASGTFTVSLAVVTADLCSAVYSEDIIIYPTPVADFAAPDVCLGNPTIFTNQSTVSSGVIILNGWDFDDTGVSANASPTHGYTTAGTFAVTLAVSSNFGCNGLITQDVNVNPLPVIDATHADISCAGLADGVATATASGSTAPYIYQWNDQLQQNTTTIQNLNAGPYMVTVTDALGCVSDTTVTIVQPLPINVNLIAGDDTCLYGNGALQAVMLGGTAPFVYVWSAIRDSSSISSTLIPPAGWNRGLSPGEYSVIVTDAGGCIVVDTATVGVVPPPVASFSTRSKPEEFNDPAVLFNNESESAYSYEWHFGDDQVGNEEDPVHDYDSSGVYLVMLIAYNEPRYGCTDTTFRYVEVDPLFTFYIPNSFTPDSDDLNDTWGPKGTNYEYESYNVQVYDRWGKMVWQTDNPNNYWDGIDQSSLEPVKQGTYIYQFILKQFNTFEPKQITGSITLYRNY